MLSLQIVTLAKGIGVSNDAHAYQSVFSEAQIVSAYQPNTFSDVNLFLNSFVVASHTWEMIQRARFNLFMVNDDLLRIEEGNSQYFEEIDFFLCKTELAVKKVNILKEKLSWKGEILYTKHTTLNDNLKFEQKKKDYSYFIHLAGQSPYKNTIAVLETWKQYHLRMLFMNCYSYCIEKFTESELKNLRQYNVHFHNERLPSSIIQQQQNNCGFHLCPSEMEGYGHYLNEGRMTGAVIISVDAPPMNELLTDECAILIPYEDTVSYNSIQRSWCKYLISPNDLYEGIQRALSLSQKQREEMGKIAFERYRADSSFFKNQLLQLKRLLK